jgi:electron transfer flavoprotein alpha subunit
VRREVLLLVDHRDGVVEPITDRLIERAGELATAAGRPVCALYLCGRETPLSERLRCAPLETIRVVRDDRLGAQNPEALGRTAAEVVRRLEPALLLCGHTFQGMDVAPWVAAKLDLPLLSNCVELRVDGDHLIAERLVYGQAWQTRLRLPWKGTVIATFARRGGSDAAPTRTEAPSVETLEIDLDALGIRSRVTENVRPSEGDVDISRAEVVVGVGRGVRDRSNLALAEELAEALGGVIACSRPLVDLEWMPYERQVGVSGKSIRPKVYVACGISGAAQHLAGIGDAETIVAINRDAKAPLFRVAHYGVVADLLEMIPALTEEARRRRAKTP